MAKLVLVRHGKTQYNLDRRFCGLTDVPLALVGIEDSKKLARDLNDFKFTAVFTSALKRTYQTAEIILIELGQVDLEIIKDPRLNERDYGTLTGKFHQEIRNVFGEEQLKLWRRSWEVAPPSGESLKDVYNRVVPMFKDEILPKILKPNNVVLICAHGNSLRALRIYLDQIDIDNLEKLEIPYDKTTIYEFDEGGLHQRVDNIP